MTLPPIARSDVRHVTRPLCLLVLTFTDTDILKSDISVNRCATFAHYQVNLHLPRGIYQHSFIHSEISIWYLYPSVLCLFPSHVYWM